MRADATSIPGVDVQAWLDAELDFVWRSAERRLRLLQQGGVRPLPNHASLAEIETTLAGRRRLRDGEEPGRPVTSETLGRAIEALDRVLAASDDRLDALRRAAPVGRIAHTLGLHPLELLTLITSIAPHIDPPLGELFALLQGLPARRAVDLSLVAQIFSVKRAGRVALLDVADQARPLMRWRLLQIAPPDSAEGYASVAHRAIQPGHEVLSLLCGRGELAPALDGCARLIREDPTLADLLIDDPVRHRLERLCQAARTDAARMPWVALWGPRGAGKAEVAARVAAYAGAPLLRLDPTVIDKASRAEQLLRAQREALLHGAVLYIGPVGGEWLTGEARELMRAVSLFPGLIIFGIEGMAPPRLRSDHPLQEIALPLPSEPVRRQLWERALPEPIRAEALDLGAVTRAFFLTPGEIFESAGEAVAGCESEARPVARSDLRIAVERRLRNELGDIAIRIEVSECWEDLVLPPDDLSRVHEFINRYRLAERVFGEWGLGRRVARNRGLIALFSGPPGTGKTMLAGLIAQALELDLYQVDLSQILSRWVGETEKNLARVFDQAERAHAVLLFDEADSLLARRTEVEQANDRHANAVVNYLLQRLERYRGVAILTTNKDAVLDEALQRRLSLHLRLGVPEPEERERLWRTFLPGTMPRAGRFEFRALAKEFELTGGYIKNAAVRAAFLAAARGQAVRMAHLRRAAVLELEDMGRLVIRREEWPEDRLACFAGNKE